jgi:copper chaperone CopZ
MLNKVFVGYDSSKVGVSDIMKVIKETGYSSHLTRRITS